MLSLIEIGHVVLEEMKLWNVYNNKNDTDTNNILWTNFDLKKLTRSSGTGKLKAFKAWRNKDKLSRMWKTKKIILPIVYTQYHDFL